MSFFTSEQFVTWFRSVAPYIHKFRHQTFVIGVCGEAIFEGKLQSIVQDLALIHSMGVRIVLVHGFRPQVHEQLKLKNHPPSYANGLRITDEVSLQCAQEAAGKLRYEIEAAFSQGLPNTPMAGSLVRVLSGNFITARPIGIVDGVNFLHSGAVRKTDGVGINKILDAGGLVLLSPFGYSPTGEAFNLSMEDVATSVAISLKSDKLIFISEVPGIPKKPQEKIDVNDNPIATEMSLAQAKEILKILPDASMPTDASFYLRHCIRACEKGISRSHIIPFSMDGSLLLEIYVHDGIGTMIVNEKLECLRMATLDDIGGILKLMTPYENDGTLIKRAPSEIEQEINEFTVLEHDGVIFGCVALHPYPDEKMGEMFALTVSIDNQSQGDGERLLKQIENQAKSMGLKSLFVLTTRTMHWFLKRGFVKGSLDQIPKSKQIDYNWDRKSVIFIKNL